MKKKPAKYRIVGCNLRYGATEETFKSCSECNLKTTDIECIDNIMVAETYYIYQRIE